MVRSNYWKAAILLNFSAMFWAGNLLFGSMLATYVGPWFIIAVRAVFGGFIFAVIIYASGGRYIFSGVRSWPLVIAMAMSGVLGFQACLYYGLRLTTPINAGLINAFTPLATALLCALFLSEPLRRDQSLAAALSIFGVAWIITGGSMDALLQLKLNPGDLLVLAAVISWCVYGILGKRVMKEMSALETAAIGLFISLIPALPAAVVETALGHPPEINSFVIIALLFIVVGPAVLALFWWNKGVQMIGPIQASLYLNMIPVYAALFSFVVLKQGLTQAQVIGACCVLGASLYAGFSAVLREKRELKDQEPAEL